VTETRSLPSMDTVIETRSLTKRFGSRAAVDSVDLTVPAGVAFGFLGPNGAGKTTMIRTLLGLTQPSSGDVSLLGLPQPAKRAEALARVGAIVEEPKFHPHLTGRENLSIVAAARDPAAEARIGESLERVGLAQRGNDRVKTYSLGMRQRLGIATALIGDPRVLVLDEPANGLDPAGIVEIRELLRDLGRNGRTVIVSSHQLSEIEAVCDHLVVIRFGELIFSGPMTEIMKRTREHIDIAAEQPEDNERLRAALAASDWSVTAIDVGLRVAAGAARAGDLNRAATAAGITLSRLLVAQDNLEEIFLEMTGRVDGELANGRGAANGKVA